MPRRHRDHAHDSVSQLKTSLSTYLRHVKTGEEVVITEHGRPIARLLPLASAAPVPEHVRNLEARGSAQARTKTPARGLLGPAAARRPARNSAGSGHTQARRALLKSADSPQWTQASRQRENEEVVALPRNIDGVIVLQRDPLSPVPVPATTYRYPSTA